VIYQAITSPRQLRRGRGGQVRLGWTGSSCWTKAGSATARSTSITAPGGWWACRKAPSPRPLLRPTSAAARAATVAQPPN